MAVKDVRIDTVPEPELRPGWVKVKNAWCGICGSDLTEWRVGPKNVPYDKPHILTGETLPTICGHEFSGTVQALGDGVTDLVIGQKVAVFPVLTGWDVPLVREGSIRSVLFLGLPGIFRLWRWHG